ISLVIDNDGCMSNTNTQIVTVNPTADTPIIVLPDFACIGDSIEVIGNVNVPNPIYHWTMNNAVLPDQQTHTYVWTQPGTHRFTLQAENNTCLSPVAVKSITIVDNPEISF